MHLNVRRSAALVMAVGALAACSWVGWATAAAGVARERAGGEALFHGRRPLPGRVVGHDIALPTLATRCSNCHEAASPAPGTAVPPLAGASTAASYAMALTAAGLAQPQPRRGGPPSRYHAAGLCNVLRNGVDPAHVLIATTMPRYDVSDDQCRQLWAYLSSR